MRRPNKLIFWNTILTLMIVSCISYAQDMRHSPNKNLYLGQELPGKTPQLFAPNILNAEHGYHGTIVFSPDGKQAYWSPMSGDKGGILMSKYENNSWSKPKSENFGLQNEVGEPTFSPTGDKIFFISTEPIKGKAKKRIWYCNKIASGWSKAKVVSESVNKHPTHWSFSVAQNGNLYFISEIDEEKNGADIYMAKYNGQNYLEPIKLSANINTALYDHTPFIAPDESYLIFSRSTLSKGNLFVSYKTKDNTWSKAINLGDTINLGKNNLSPKVSPDGKYLFYICYKPGDKYRMYWVDASMVEDLRPKN